MFEHRDAKITWLGHDGFKIESEGQTLVIDPFKLKHDVLADYVLISHEHFDHLNAEDLKKVVKPKETTVVSIAAAKEEVSKVSPKEFKIVKPGDHIKLGTFDIRAVPAYNTNKFAEPGKPFHPKQDGKVGYIVTTKAGVSIYHTGDSDLIPEMDNLRPEIALLPVSGTYVMTVDEAVEAAGRIKPKIAIPMHYGAIVGSEDDAKKFKNSVRGVEVHILTAE
ncbi:MAG TPA: MBL fold metallo-hydrolase [Nitrososphaerales archaeon]|nr:MBL fold metallo-hydrolase [Nitrososphaerales archaeon]